MTDPGEIQIIGYRQDAFLIIEILDNGVGFRDADIDQILSRSLPLNKLGVGNTNQRIKLYCGDSFGLKIYPRQPSGTRVVLTLPFHDGAGAELGGEHV